jgi:hypothetical protein
LASDVTHHSRRRTASSAFKGAVLVCAFAACALAFATGDGAATQPATLVVDDDGVQCANFDFKSIQEAVDEAQPGWVVRVCPGYYAESVTVDKPLTIVGQPDAVEALDCFDPTASAPGDLDPTQHVIVDGSQSAALALFTLAADDITLAGFVFQGATNPPPLPPLPAGAAFLRRAIDVSGDYSGYRIHHNLIRLNTVGVELGSNGESSSRFDHNCLRRNGWGLATDFRDLMTVSIDRNATFDTQNFAFELFGVRPEDRRKDITLAHNVSRQDNTSYLVVGTVRTTVIGNTIESPRVGIRVDPGNLGLEISRNVINNDLGTNRFGSVLQGIAFVSPTTLDQEPTAGALVRENTITKLGFPVSNGVGDGIVAAGPPNADRHALINSLIVDNVTSDNLRDGIVLRGANSGNTLRGNVSDRNGRFGIFVQGAVRNGFELNVASENGADGISLQRAIRSGVNYDATDNTFAANIAERNGRYGVFADAFAVRNTFVVNRMFENAIHDAHDSDSNTWIANQCVTDFPFGTICGVG